MAIAVVRKFLGEISQEENGVRQALNAVKKLRYIALSDAGIFVFQEYGIDVLSTIDVDFLRGQNL